MSRASRASIKRSNTPANPGCFSPYFCHAAYSAGLPKRAAFVKRQLSLVTSIFRELFSDENFRTLMRAESLTAVPVHFKPLLEEAGKHGLESHSRRRR